MGDEEFTGVHTFENENGNEQKVFYTFIVSNERPGSRSLDIEAYSAMANLHSERIEKPRKFFSTQISTIKELEEQSGSSDKPILLCFFSEDCDDCRIFAPFYEQSSKRLKKQFTFLEANANNSDKLCIKFAIKELPTVILLDSEGNQENSLESLESIGAFFQKLIFESYSGFKK